MPLRLWLRIAEILIPVTLATTLFVAWRADRRDRAHLTAEIAAANQTLAQADARQRHRDAQLLQTLAALAAEKRTVTTPAQIVRELPIRIPLPAPIAVQSTPAKVSGPEPVSELSTAPTPNSGQNPNQPRNQAQTQAVIPMEDLKPLYDFVLDCKACQAKLAAAEGDLADEKAKTTALTRERDASIRAAKGGSVLRRAAKWLAIGAAAGAIAAKAHH